MGKISRFVIFLVVLLHIANVKGQGSSSSSSEEVNWVINAGFEEGQSAWSPYSPDPCVVTNVVQLSGLNSLECRNPGPSHKQQGLKQSILLNQESAQPILISGYSRAENVAGTIPNFYGVYAEIRYEDGSTLVTSALFFEGSHDWSYSEKVIWSPHNKRILVVELYVTFSNHTGVAWFDDIDIGPYEVPTEFNYGFKYLIIATSSEDVHIASAQQVMDSVGAKYDLLTLVDKNQKIIWKDTPLPLEKNEVTGKYAGIITTSNTFVAQINGVAQTVLHDAHLLQLENYYNKYRVKHVCIYAYPYSNLGVTDVLTGNTYQGTITIPPETTSLITGTPQQVIIPVASAYMYPSNIADSTMAKPAIYLNAADKQNAYVGGSFLSSVNGWTRLYFFLDHGAWSLHTKVLGNLWFQWLTNGIYFGMRRIYLQPQIDDLFLSTGIYDPSKSLQDQEDNQDQVRVDGDDIMYVASWQEQLNKRLPRGSSFATEIAYNGDGVKLATMNNDALFQTSLSHFSNFFWESHTFTHPNLTALNYSQVFWELQENNRFSNNVFFPRVNGSVEKQYSFTAMVTPSISGLFTSQSLRALYDSGIRNVVGDNSVAKLLPPNLYHGIYTTTEVHGFPGIFIIPRQATNIYYNTPTAASLVSQFNQMYAATYGRALTLEEIMDKESDVATSMLVAYRHDPYMFHQANLHTFNYNGKDITLYTMWVDTVVDKLLKYVTLPVLSVKHDQLAEVLKARMERDKCEVEATVVVRNELAMEIILSSKQPCVTAITGFILGTCCGCPQTSVEAYGPDVTTYIALPGANVEVVLPLLVPKKVA